MSIKSAFATGLSSLVLVSSLSANSPKPQVDDLGCNKIEDAVSSVYQLVQNIVVREGGKKEDILIEVQDLSLIDKKDIIGCKVIPSYTNNNGKIVKDGNVIIFEVKAENAISTGNLSILTDKNLEKILKSPDCLYNNK